MKKFFVFLFLINFISIELYAQKYYQIKWDNKPRNYIVYLPKNFSVSENLPLVINMHGFLTTAQFQMDYTQFNKTADTARCIVIYPEGIDLRWNSGTFFFVPSSVDDIGFLNNLIDRAAVLYNANMKKVFAMGYSAGGFMSYKLACDLTNRITAIVPNVASMVDDNISSCVPARPINIAAFNGLADPITPYDGFPFNFPSIDSIKKFWQIKNNCNVNTTIDTLPNLKNDGTRVVKYTYNNCAENVEQNFYKIINGGHVWPGAANIFFDILGKTTQDISLNNEAWNFFRNKEIPTAVICNTPTNLKNTAVANDSFLLSWTPNIGALNYKIAMVDDSDKITFYETNTTTFGVKINPLKKMRWNVSALCSSGYHNWATTQNLNSITTPTKNNKTQVLNIFPNPASTEIFVKLPNNNYSNLNIKIYDLLGKIVYASTSLPSNNKIEIGFLENGLYQLIINTENEIFVNSFYK